MTSKVDLLGYCVPTEEVVGTSKYCKCKECVPCKSVNIEMNSS